MTLETEPGFRSESVCVEIFSRQIPCSVRSHQKALHVRALRPFKDAAGRDRRTGEEWLVTMSDREAHIPSVAEEVVGVVDVTTLSSRQYCVILDPVGADGKPQLGQKSVVKVTPPTASCSTDANFQKQKLDPTCFHVCP